MDKRIQLILKEIRPSDSILDIGCVNHDLISIRKGNWLHGYLCKISSNVLGIDIEEDSINQMKATGYNVLFANCEKLDLDQTFDVIIAGEVIEHLSNPGLFLEGVKRHLKPTGKFILSVPNAYCYYNILSSMFRSKVPVHEQHACWYDKTTIKQLIQRYSFEISGFEYLPIPKTGRGRFLSLLLYKLGFLELSACGFLIICKKKSDAIC